MKTFGVIVIGAGNAGLTAAATCASGGLKTLLLEKNGVVGGSAQSFRRGRFEFECSLHELGGIGSPEAPGPVRELLEKLGVRIAWRMDENLFRAIVVGDGGRDMTVPAMVGPLCAWMEKQYPGSGSKVRKIFDLVKGALLARDYIKSGSPNPKTLMSEHTDFLRLVSYSARECMNALGIPEDAQKVLDSYWPYLGVLPDEQDAFHYFYMLWLYVEFGPMMPSKKSPEITFALEKVILDNGGEIWKNTEVTGLLVRDGAVYGVKTDDGLEILAERVLCSWFPNGVIQAAGSENIPDRFLKLTNSRKLGPSFVNVYLGLNRTAGRLGIRDYTVLLFPTADEHEAKDRCGGYGIGGLLIANCLNIVIPESSPEGTCTLAFSMLVYGDEWGKIRPEDYYKKKNEVAEWAIGLYEKQMGITIRPYIEEIEIATPVTLARFINTPNGTPYGYQTVPGDSIFARTLNLNSELLYNELRFCGAHAEKGEGYCANISCGSSAALQTIKELKDNG